MAPIIIIVCTLLMIGYIFEISSAKTKIPSVILLILLGWCVGEFVDVFEIYSPDLDFALPTLGTIGLILIVLEGSLELELNESKFGLVKKSLMMALLPILSLSLLFGGAFFYMFDISFMSAFINAIPFAVISSSIAIPSARNLGYKDKEFITYESSLSDIFGVILFNFFALKSSFSIYSPFIFILEIVAIFAISFVSALALAFMLSKIKNKVKFAPVILAVILVYAVSKFLHLPSLTFILLFGIFLGNLDELKQFKLIQKLQPDILNNEVHKLKDLATELVFLIKALFFLLFGYLIETEDLLNAESAKWAFFITAGIFVVRFIYLKVLGLSAHPLLYLAPRGLITVLLFFSIPASKSIEVVNKPLVIQVVIFTAVAMMLGLLTVKGKDRNTEIPPIVR